MSHANPSYIRGLLSSTIYQILELSSVLLSCWALAADALPASNLESDSTTAPSSLDGRQSPQPAFRPPPHNGSSGQHQQPTASLSTAQAADLHSRNGTSRPGAAPAAAPLTSTGAAPKAPPPAAMPPSAASKGRTLIPTDIPKLGGARPKQTGSVSPRCSSPITDSV